MNNAKQYRESQKKRHTRSVHEKKRRQEMNDVIEEMADVIPEIRPLFDAQNKSKIIKKPDKCFVISYAVDYMKSLANNMVIQSDPMLFDCLSLTDCLIVKMKDYIIVDVEGNCNAVFGLDKDKLSLKDFRSLLDFECAVHLPAVIHNSTPFILKSYTGKFLTCSSKSGKDSSIVVVLISVPNSQTAQKPKQTKIQKSIVEESPLLAALLRKNDNEASSSSKVAVDTTPAASLHCDSASVSSPPFLSPLSSSSAGTALENTTKTSKRKKKEKAAPTTSRRKRLRSVSAIVESFSLDGEPEKTTTVSHRLTSIMPTPSTSTIVNPPCPPMVLPFLNVNPYEVLSPGYRDIWLRLQSERQLLEHRVLAKEKELQGLMLSSASESTYPHSSFVSLPQCSSTPHIEVITTQIQ